MTDALAVSRNSRAALVAADGRFMVGSEMAARAKELGRTPAGCISVAVSARWVRSPATSQPRCSGSFPAG